MKHVWISQGDVLVREKDDSMVVKIQSKNQISEIEKKTRAQHKRQIIKNE